MSSPNIRCREIQEADLDDIADLLTRGFVGRPRDYWVRGLERQSRRDIPPGYPRYGYMLECDGRAVGVLLLIVSSRRENESAVIRCNVASWYVDPPYRGYGAQLSFRAQRHKNCTFVNVTPASVTWPIIEAIGFKRYCSGLFFAIPSLAARENGMSVEIVGEEGGVPGLSETDDSLLAGHAAYGGLSLVCRTAAGEALPFAFLPMRARCGRVPLPGMTLIHCRDVAEFIRCAGTIGRFLLPRGRLVVSLDANGPVEGLIGLYTERRGRKYFMGSDPPRLADLAETELTVFGP